MSVAELIETLQAVEDKSLPVYVAGEVMVEPAIKAEEEDLTVWRGYETGWIVEGRRFTISSW